MVSNNEELVALLNRHGSSKIKLLPPFTVRTHDGEPNAKEVTLASEDAVESYLQELAWVILQMSANHHAREAERHTKLQGEALMEFNLMFGNP
jgi:hypothetical protein